MSLNSAGDKNKEFSALVQANLKVYPLDSYDLERQHMIG
jgi:hypothetical protein